MATAPCNEAGPAKLAPYEPKGKTVTVDELPIYVTGTGQHAIIVVYDVLGWNVNKNVFELSDRFAAEGFTVVMCDHFRGKPWPADRLPFKNDEEQKEFFGWFTKNGAPEIVVKDLKEIGFPYIEKTLKCTRITAFGVCWGGGMVFHIGNNPKISGIAAIHASRITEELANTVKCPVFYGPTAKDTPVETVKKILDQKDFAKKCIYHTFETMEHGFCGSRGDWSKPDIKKNVNIVFEEMIKFCK